MNNFHHRGNFFVEQKGYYVILLCVQIYHRYILVFEISLPKLFRFFAPHPWNFFCSICFWKKPLSSNLWNPVLSEYLMRISWKFEMMLVISPQSLPIIHNTGLGKRPEVFLGKFKEIVGAVMKGWNGLYSENGLIVSIAQIDISMWG